MENKDIMLAWKERIVEIAEDSKEDEVVPIKAKSAEKSPKNQTFPFSYLSKLWKNINKSVHLQISRLEKFWKTDTTNDLKGIITFVVGYGILGEFVLLTFKDGWQIESQTVIHIIGVGSAIYLFMDLLKYVADTIRG